MLGFYIKSALRSISRKKNFSILSIAGLGLGISVFLLSLQYYSFETGYNRFHKNLPKLYRVNLADGNNKTASTYPTIAPLIQQRIPGIKNAIRIADNFNSGAIVSYQPGADASKRKSFREDGCVFADKSLLDAFSFPLVEGTNELDKTNTVVITNAIAHKLFNNESAVGKIIHLHNQFGELPATVTGVITDMPEQSDIKFEYLFSIQELNNAAYIKGSDWARLDSWGNNSYTTYVQLDDKVNPAAIAATASALYAQNKTGYKKEDGKIQLQPLGEIHLGSSLSDDNPAYGSRPMVYFILGLGILVLCIAWINYINFSTAFALSQAKEIGIHKIIGSNKRKIVYRYVAESLFLNAAGIFIAFVLVNLVQGLFNYVTGKPLALHYINNPAVWLKGLLVLFAGILLSGAYAGWLLSRFKPIAAIRFNSKGNMGSALLRKGLVTFQFIISILFISCTLIAYDQIQFMKKHDLGMNINNLVVINGPAIRDSAINTSSAVFADELAKLPFVEKLSSTGSVPGVGFAHNFSADGITKLNPVKGDENKNYLISIVDENYFDTYQIKFSSGQNFTAADAGKGFKGDKLIINETAARQLGLDPATATSTFIQWGKSFQIAGVVKDYHHRSLKEKIEPIVFVPQHNTACYTLKMNFDNLPQKMSTIKSLYDKTYPGNPFEYKILKETYNTQYADEQRAGVIGLSLSVFVILIACLGLIGLSVFTAKRRTKEIGIRKVLGARTASLFALLSKDFLLLVFIAFIIATPIAWWMMTKWLQEFANQTNISWTVFAIAGAAAMLIALITVSFQSIKAAIATPVKSLRTE